MKMEVADRWYIGNSSYKKHSGCHLGLVSIVTHDVLGSVTAY